MILTTDKREVQLKLIRSDKEGNFIPIKWTIHQEDITVILNIYAQNSSALNFIEK